MDSKDSVWYVLSHPAGLALLCFYLAKGLVWIGIGFGVRRVRQHRASDPVDQSRSAENNNPALAASGPRCSSS